MANKRKKFAWVPWALGGVVVLGVLAGLNAKSLSVSDGQRVYPVKFTCGIMYQKNAFYQTRPFGGALNPGRYTTSINIQNPSKEAVKITKAVLLAPREPDSGTASTTVVLNLPGRSATSADCPDIYSIISMPTSTQTYIEGFLDVVSKNDLYVSAIYTGQNLKSDGTLQDMSTMDVERIPAEALPK